MKTYLLATAVALFLAPITMTEARAQDSACGEISIAQMGWTSAEVITEVVVGGRVSNNKGINLPGVAGLIVAIGVTADSFIIYFERIRDEVRDGRSLRTAIETGWISSRKTILIADAVSLLSAAVLFVLAIGSVKGFAFTLGVTTAIDLLLVIFFTHPLMTLLGRTTFFGEGHKNSGLDPQHLGVSRASLLGRRGTTRKRTKPDASAARKPGTSKKAEEASHE